MTGNPYPKHQPLTAAQIAQTELVQCSPDTLVSDAIRMMAQQNIGCVIVCEDSQPVGIFTRRDVIQMFAEPETTGDIRVREVMSSPVRSVSASTLVDDAGLIFMRAKIRHLMVLDDDQQLYGVLSETDIVNSQGLEHDLFLRSIGEIAAADPLILPDTVSLKSAMSAMRNAKRSAALIRNDHKVYSIITEKDMMRLVAAGKVHCTLAETGLKSLISISGDTSLYNARKAFRQHGIHHLGVADHQGEIFGLVSYSDILRSVEYDYVYRLKELLNERNQALQVSQHNLRLADKVINSSMEAIVITDKHGVIQRVNPAFTEITGYEEWEALGQNPNMLSSGRHDDNFYQQMWQQLVTEGHWQGEIWNRRKDGSVYPEWLSITAIEDEQGQISQYASIFSDLTEIKKSEARIKRLAYFDELTRLANRKLFHDRLSLAAGYAREHDHQIALALIDLDLFKRVNDRYGRKIGDEVLKVVARRLEELVEEGDTVARPGGDEFNLILTDVDDSSVAQFVANLNKAIAEPIQLAGAEVRISGSIGVSFLPNDTDDTEELLRCADAALTQAKEYGRNSFRFFSSEMHNRLQSRYQLGNDLQRALSKNQFELYYQPKVSLADDQLAGVEALLRWHRPEGPVSPAEFIPLAENIGLIDEIGEWVLQQSISQARHWLDQGLRVPVAVNVSAKQIQREGLADRVIAALSEHQLPAELLVIELTESSFLHSFDETRFVIDQLRNAGIKVAIDDFGTGYSSLSYIRNMSLDELKIDRSFVMNLSESASDRSIVSAIISMSQALGLKVVAEGIETTEQKALLAELGCDQAQGYLMARPMPASQLPQWLKQWQPVSD